MSLNRIEHKERRRNRGILRLTTGKKGERRRDCSHQEMIELEEVLVLTNHARVKIKRMQ